MKGGKDKMASTGGVTERIFIESGRMKKNEEGRMGIEMRDGRENNKNVVILAGLLVKVGMI